MPDRPRLAEAIGGDELLPQAPPSVLWSPSGDRLAYVAANSDDVWVADGEGRNARFVARGYRPTWSPDGRSLAFLPPVRLHEPSREVVVVDVETGATRTALTLSDIAADLIAAGYAPYRLWPTSIQDIAWSPDGELLALRAGLQDRSGNSHAALFTATPEGGDRRLWLVMAQIGRLSWSPDGRALAVASRGYDETLARIHVIAAHDETQANVAVADLLWTSNFAWSPDGQWIAVRQQDGPAILSADLAAVWRLQLPGCRIGGWRPDT
jgi:Tol biopolymer transport system component